MFMSKWIIPLSLGAAAGAVAIMMMPRQNPARRLASDAACKVESAVAQMADKITDQIGI